MIGVMQRKPLFIVPTGPERGMRSAKLLKLSELLAVVAFFGLLLSEGEGLSQTGAPTTHTIFMTALEVKGATTTNNLAPLLSIRKIYPRGTSSSDPGKPTKVTLKSGGSRVHVLSELCDRPLGRYSEFDSLCRQWR